MLLRAISCKGRPCNELHAVRPGSGKHVRQRLMAAAPGTL